MYKQRPGNCCTWFAGTIHYVPSTEQRNATSYVQWCLRSLFNSSVRTAYPVACIFRLKDTETLRVSAKSVFRWNVYSHFYGSQTCLSTKTAMIWIRQHSKPTTYQTITKPSPKILQNLFFMVHYCELFFTTQKEVPRISRSVKMLYQQKHWTKIFLFSQEGKTWNICSISKHTEWENSSSEHRTGNTWIFIIMRTEKD